MPSTGYPSKFYRKPSLEENIDRNSVLFKSIFEAIIFLWIFIWFLTGLLNLFPMIAWGYGFIWHVFNFLAIPSTIIVAYSDVRPLINIVLIISIVNFIVNGFALGLILYTLAICYIESIPSNCIDFQFTDILISLLSAVLWVISFFVLLSLISLTRRINKSVSEGKRNIKNVNKRNKNYS
jgi:hypothetical protein